MTDSTNRASATDVTAAPGPTDRAPRARRAAWLGWDRRAIGPLGAAARLVLGGLLLWWGLAVPHRHPWLDLPGAGSRGWGLLVGLVVVPALLTAVVAARGRAAAPLRLGSSEAACVVTGVLVLVSFVVPVVVLTFVGGTMVLLAVAGRGGCEVMAVPNLALGRHDYLACLGVSQLDAWEARRRRHRGPRDGGGAP